MSCLSILSMRIPGLAKCFAGISVYSLYHTALIKQPNISEVTSEKKSDDWCDVLCDPIIVARSSLISCVRAYKLFFEYCNELPGGNIKYTRLLFLVLFLFTELVPLLSHPHLVLWLFSYFPTIGIQDLICKFSLMVYQIYLGPNPNT